MNPCPPRSTPDDHDLLVGAEAVTGLPMRCSGIFTFIRNRSPPPRVSLISSRVWNSISMTCLAAHRTLATVGMFSRS